MKKWGWLLFMTGFACILAGILAKRAFDIRESLVWFHIAGGILIIVGGMLAFGDRAAKRGPS